ncbi:MAG: hypothetical protein ACOX3W_05920 [Christensenellaceae bacterium]
MEEKRVCKNTHPCTCPNENCSRHGTCCDCVAHHMAQGNIPMCVRELNVK